MTNVARALGASNMRSALVLIAFVGLRLFATDIQPADPASPGPAYAQLLSTYNEDPVTYGVILRDEDASLEFLRQVTEATGGRMIRANQNGLESAFQRILAEFSARYLLTYSPTDVTPGWHRIDAAIDNPRAFNCSLHITGPEPLTPLDAVAIAERVTGRRFTVQRVPVLVLRAVTGRAAAIQSNPRVAARHGGRQRRRRGNGHGAALARVWYHTDDVRAVRPRPDSSGHSLSQWPEDSQDGQVLERRVTIRNPFIP